MDKETIDSLFYIIATKMEEINVRRIELENLIKEAMGVINGKHPYASYTLEKIDQLMSKFPELTRNKTTIEG